MPALQATDIGDVVLATLRELGRLRFQQIAQNLQDYEVFSRWFRKDKVAFDSGIGIQRTLMTKLSGAARHVGLLDEDQVNIPDILTNLKIDWRHAQTSYGFIYQEALMNRGKALIVDVVKPRRTAALIDMVEELEDKAWAAPTGPSDKTNPYGIKYWIVRNATEGFNGGVPSGFSDVGGVDLTEHPNFKNWTGQYAAVSKTDLIRKMRKAHRNIRFKSPITVKDYRGGRGDRYRIYMNETTIAAFEDIGESQNENLGRDVASMDGTITFRNHPCIWVPKLDSDTADPVYMIDHSTFYPVVLKGDFLRESKAIQAPNQHNVYQYFVDLTYNYLCVDRRRNAVFYK